MQLQVPKEHLKGLLFVSYPSFCVNGQEILGGEEREREKGSRNKKDRSRSWTCVGRKGGVVKAGWRGTGEEEQSAKECGF